MDRQKLKELYDKDFVLWAEINHRFLKEKAYELVDWENLLEEILGLAQEEYDRLISLMAIVMASLYKQEHFEFLKEVEVKECQNQLYITRLRIKNQLRKYPSLEEKLPQLLQTAWEEAIVELRIWLREKDHDPDSFSFPKECPYGSEEILGERP